MEYDSIVMLRNLFICSNKIVESHLDLHLNQKSTAMVLSSMLPSIAVNYCG